jgi:hypothetical protein
LALLFFVSTVSFEKIPITIVIPMERREKKLISRKVHRLEKGVFSSSNLRIEKNNGARGLVTPGSHPGNEGITLH